MRELSQIRKQIDRIDHDISKLFVERLEVSAEVAEYKRATGKPIYDRTRERQNIAAASSRVPAEYASYAAVIQTVLMEASREAQHKALGRKSHTAQRVEQALGHSPAFFPLRPHVACQGVEGAYQQIACDRMFRHPSIDFFPTFEDVFRKIDHNLLVKPGTAKEDVRIVYSHQQAINQCADYLATIPNCRVHVCENTARAAQMVSQSDRSDVAALASRACADLYGLQIAEPSVQDNQNNYTRFACISKDLTIYPGAERSSLMAVVNHEPGALHNVLARFYALDINLIKLESRPIANRDFEFMFYFDIECPAAAPEFGVLMDSLDDVCEHWRYLGSYTEVV